MDAMDAGVRLRGVPRGTKRDQEGPRGLTVEAAVCGVGIRRIGVDPDENGPPAQASIARRRNSRTPVSIVESLKS